MERTDERTWFCQAVEALKKTAFSVSYTLLANASECEDATSAAILSAYEHLYQLKNKKCFNAWFLRILKNECYARIRARANILPLDERIPAHTDGLAVENIDLQRALMQLPASWRAAVILQVVEGYSIDEIALILDVPGGTVKSRLHRARAALRMALKEEELAQ